MLLRNKTAVVYGAGGAIGGALSRVFAEEGARVFLAGRTKGKLKVVANEISAAGGRAEWGVVDALDPSAVDAHLEAVIEQAGGVDISINAIGVDHVQATKLTDMTPEEYGLPIATYTRSNFVTATAAARHMAARRSGVILAVSTTAARLPGGLTGGFSTACAAIEALSLQLAAELGPTGVRVVCLRSDGIPETARMGSHSARVWKRYAEHSGVTLDEFLDEPSNGLLGRHVTLAELAHAAAFFASDAASAMTASVANISAGAVVG